jgi:hypothetical protein
MRINSSVRQHNLVVIHTGVEQKVEERLRAAGNESDISGGGVSREIGHRDGHEISGNGH